MSVVAKKSGGVKYRLVKERIPQGTDVVHYIVPIEVNGRKTQEIPVSELETNPGKYATMFPQYIEKVRTSGNGVTIKPLSKEYKVQNGVVTKIVARRTIHDVKTPASESKAADSVNTVAHKKEEPVLTTDDGSKRRK